MALAVCNAYGEVISGARVRVEDKDSHSIARISAPGYLRRTIVLRRAGRPQTAFLGLDLDTATAPDLNSLEAACARNLHAASRFACVDGTTLHKLTLAPVHWYPDRLYYATRDTLTGDTIAAFDRTEAWTRADSSLHHPPDTDDSGEWENLGSWKQTQPEPGLQVVVWWRAAEGYVFEVDLDEHKDIFGHVYEVLRNHLTGRLTHPHVINQALARKRGIISYRLEPAPDGLPQSG